MDILIRKGDGNDTEQFIQLLQEVRENMAHKEWFYLDPPEDVRAMMDNGTMELWVAMDGDRMAAAVDILRPGLQAFNYGYDLSFTEKDLLRVINMDNAAVRSDYRGQGLQRILIQAAEQQLEKEGNHILLCTVHPENSYSLRNVLSLGYEVQKRMEKYGSVRYILQKNI